MAHDRFREIPTKSSIILGVGETDDNVTQILRGLRRVGCERLTTRQHLQPCKESLDVAEYVRPEKFDWWRSRTM